MTGAGWIGDSSELLGLLAAAGADRDGDGRYLIGGTGFSGLGGVEVVLGEDAYFSVQGERRLLLPALEAAGLGVSGFTVIS